MTLHAHRNYPGGSYAHAQSRTRRDRLTSNDEDPEEVKAGLGDQEDPCARARERAWPHEQGNPRPLGRPRHRCEEPLQLHRGPPGRPRPAQGRPAGHPSRRAARRAEEGRAPCAVRRRATASSAAPAAASAGGSCTPAPASGSRSDARPARGSGAAPGCDRGPPPGGSAAEPGQSPDAQHTCSRPTPPGLAAASRSSSARPGSGHCRRWPQRALACAADAASQLAPAAGPPWRSPGRPQR